MKRAKEEVAGGREVAGLHFHIAELVQGDGEVAPVQRTSQIDFAQRRGHIEVIHPFDIETPSAQHHGQGLHRDLAHSSQVPALERGFVRQEPIRYGQAASISSRQ